MEATVKKVITKLHEETVESHYSKATWKGLLSQRLSDQQLAILNNSARAGLMYLRDDAITTLASREYPWMINQIEVEEKDTNGKVHMVKKSSWLDRIRNVGVIRPKDLIHLSNIVALAENREAIEEMEW